MQQPQHVRVAIVGSGFGGLGMAIRLVQSNQRDFVVLEREAEIGGVWRDNSYPGCACDVESHLYSFSFARNPEWSRAYSPQAEILAYLKACAERFGLAPHLRLGHEVRAVTWDATLDRWRLDTSHGELTADVLVAAVGALSEPAIPELPGLDTFEGAAFHSARWDHDHDLTGRDVAVIGTGASAIQFIPAIQPRVRSLTVFQRTPAWILPRNDRTLSERTKRLLRASSFAQLAMRGGIYAYRELFAFAFLDARLAKLVQRAATRHLAQTISDPALRAKLTPSYTIGCKRVLISDDYLPAMAQPNVTLETSGVAEVTPDAVIARDGTRYSVDTILFGTGFQVQSFPFGHAIRGRDGRTLHEAWGGRMTAHLGTTIAGFPNLFVLQGPNTGLGHTSVLTMMESQIEHVLGALAYMDREHVAALEPTPEAQAAFVAEIEARTRGTVWTAGGCDSWYLDASGRNSTLWPGFTFSFKRRVETFRPREYAVVARRPAPVVLGAVDRVRAVAGRAIAVLPAPVQRQLAGRPVVIDGQTLAPDMQLVLAALGKEHPLLASSPGQLRHEQRVAALVAAGPPVPVGAVRELTVEDLRARHYAPEAAAGAPLLVFLHGGGFVFGDLETHDRVCRVLCRHAGVHVLAVEYRLAPEHPFPAAPEDAERAWRWARRHARLLGADPERVAIGGDSAGGNLATVVSQRTAGTPDAPACQLLLYPTVDHHGAYPSKELFARGFFLTRETMAWFHEQYIETIGAARDDIRHTPLAAPDLSNQPPALIVTAGFDPLRDEAEAYAEALRRHGSVAVVRRFESLLHGFANMTGVSRSAAEAMIEIAGMLRGMLGMRPQAENSIAVSSTRAYRNSTRSSA